MAKKILFILNSLNCGGEENYVMNLYRQLKCRENRNGHMEFSFLVCGSIEQKQYFEQEILNNGDKVYKVSGKFKHPVQNFLEIYHIVKDNKFEVVHRHSDNSLMVLDLWAAAAGGAKCLIAHSHTSSIGKYKIIHYIFRPFLNCCADYRYACSKVAGEWMYGTQKFRIAKNGIDIKKFLPNHKKRAEVRNRLGITNQVLLGHVGRFDKVKNHAFLIDIIRCLSRTEKDYRLLLIGIGGLEKDIREKVKAYGLQKKVIFAGQQKDIGLWLQAVDVFVFPSIYEGLPLSLIEAQASGTVCLVSDAVSSEASVTSLLEFLPLNAGARSWAERVEELAMECKKSDKSAEITRAGYDIRTVADRFAKLYERV